MSFDRPIREQKKLNKEIGLNVTHPLDEGQKIRISYTGNPDQIAANIARARKTLKIVLKYKDATAHRAAYEATKLRDPNVSLEQGGAKRLIEKSLLENLLQPALWNSFAAFGEKSDVEGLQKILKDKIFYHHHAQVRSILGRIDATVP